MPMTTYATATTAIAGAHERPDTGVRALDTRNVHRRVRCGRFACRREAASGIPRARSPENACKRARCVADPAQTDPPHPQLRTDEARHASCPRYSGSIVRECVG